jgi:formamidopyrimidine-DNA glycosylase
MPELPEVETVKEKLKKELLKKRINEVNVFYDGIIATDLSSFKKNIVNQEIIDITRRGKFLIFELTNYYLVSHLRMEGKYFIKSNELEINKHDHVIFYFDNFILCYNDTRKFGKMYLVTKDKLLDTPINKLGKEPWDKELTCTYLKDKFNKNIAIKTLLLDQSIISGIGNIYADEILFLSCINPSKKGKALKTKDINNIIDNTKKVLEQGIKNRGTTIHSFTSLGVTGDNQNHLLVHTREGLPCPVCKSIIRKIKVNGRGTYYCPVCQKGD